MQNLRFALVAVGAIVLPSTLLCQTITSFAPSNPTRSGLVRVYGSGFGNQSTGSVIVSGRPAHIARWTNTLIEFYIPEGTLPFPTKILISQLAGRKAIFAVDVRNRPDPTSRFQWRFEAADQYIVTRPALGPDGTIYAVGNFGHLYAIAPNGALKWLWSKGADGCVDVGADGTIYCAGGGGIQAFSPNGARLWVFKLNSAIFTGPNVGPDGNIYAADNSRWNASPTGAVVLSPNGSEIWSGGVFYGRGGTHQTEFQFDQNRAFIWSEGDLATGAVAGLRAILLGGGLDWRNGDIVGFQPGGYTSGGVVAHGTSTTQRMATNGSLIWSFDLWSIGGAQPRGDVLAASDGGAYFLTANTRLNAIGSSGALRYSNTLGGILSDLTLSPDGSKLLLQKANNFGQPFHLEAYSSGGTFLWRSEDLPIESGMPITIYNRMKFAPSGDAVYFGTAGPMLSADTATSYVYAMDAR